jgi:ubiquinone/menaquinone biosynthesis C-methylase UbiE
MKNSHPIPHAHPDTAADDLPLWGHELDLMDALLPLHTGQFVELGCGGARLAREWLARHAQAHITALEVDTVQMAKNLQTVTDRLNFVSAGAQAIPTPALHFDGALMLKSLHHVPMPDLDTALSEVARVLKPGGWFYVSEPIYAGALNEIVRLYNDEGVVRPAAQAALDRAVVQGLFEPVSEHRFAQAVRFADFETFAQRMLYPSFADHRVTPELLAQVASAYAPHQREDGAHFVRPMHVRVLRRSAATPN